MPPQPIEYTLDVNASVAAGDAQEVAGLYDKWVHITGSFTATLDVEVSADGANWDAIATVSAAATIEVAPNTKYLRINTTAYTSGTPAAILIASM